VLRRVGEICDIVGHESVRAAINSRLKHHFIIRIPLTVDATESEPPRARSERPVLPKIHRELRAISREPADAQGASIRPRIPRIEVVWPKLLIAVVPPAAKRHVMRGARPLSLNMIRKPASQTGNSS